MKPGCAECRRLARMLEEAAIHYYEMAQHEVSLPDNDPEKVWAGMALRGTTEAKDEIQWRFNEHLAKHATYCRWLHASRNTAGSASVEAATPPVPRRRGPPPPLGSLRCPPAPHPQC